MTFDEPSESTVRDALARYAQHLADLAIGPLRPGWFLWAYRAGDYVLRFPRIEAGCTQLALESRVLTELAPHLTTRIPSIEVYCDDPALPFTAHRLIPGEPVMHAPMAPADSFGRDLGRFIRELHAIPIERALELGVPLRDGPTQRDRRGRQYTDIVRRVFPIVSAAMRATIESVYERYFGEPANFDYRPCLVHQDLDSNVLVDSASGEMTGVIDFGALVAGSPAMDLWLPAYGFQRLGIARQTSECLDAAGVTDADFERMRPELEFIDFRWPLLDILHGLDTGDSAYVRGGTEELELYVERTSRLT